MIIHIPISLKSMCVQARVSKEKVHEQGPKVNVIIILTTIIIIIRVFITITMTVGIIFTLNNVILRISNGKFHSKVMLITTEYVSATIVLGR